MYKTPQKPFKAFIHTFSNTKTNHIQAAIYKTHQYINTEDFKLLCERRYLHKYTSCQGTSFQPKAEIFLYRLGSLTEKTYKSAILQKLCFLVETSLQRFLYVYTKEIIERILQRMSLKNFKNTASHSEK